MEGGGVSVSILLRGEGRVIRGGGAQKKNLQISDLQRLASLLKGVFQTVPSLSDHTVVKGPLTSFRFK